MISTLLARADENLRAAGVSRAVLAVVVGMKPSSLSAAFNGVVNLGHREGEVLTASHRILDAAIGCQPFLLPKDAQAVKVLVTKLADGALTTDQIRERVAFLFE